MHSLIRKLLLACLTTALLVSSPAQAQTAARVFLLPPDLSRFPTVTVFMDASAADGAFLSGLGPSGITLLEDDQAVEVTQLLEERPGVEVLVAVNPAPAMAIRDSRGTPRFEHIQASLQAWADIGAGSTAETYTFIANGIQPVDGLESRQALAAEAVKYRPDFKRSVPGLDSLAQAVDLALTPPSAPGTDRLILYITPPPEGEQLAALQSLRERAGQSGARICVWMVGSTKLFDSPGARELASLAESSGGQFIPYSGVEDLPTIDPALEGLGRIYSLQYTSALRSGKDHTLTAEIDLDGEILRSDAQNFDYDILPPNPMFISPPSSIERTAPRESENPLNELTPRSITLQTMVEFPDGRIRALNYARLYVDGLMASELKEAPFDQFPWDISGYTTSGTHKLRLEVEDAYGLVSSSLETPVDVAVVIPQLSMWEQVTRPKTLASLGAFILAGIILGLVLFFAGRRRSGVEGRRADRDPLTQPVPGQKDGRSRDNSLPWKRGTSVPGAVLVPLGENNIPVDSSTALPLIGSEITFGRDPSLAAFVLDSPTVDNLHARMHCTGGVYVLADNSSVAGTWVNYAPISREGLRLEHGDIIHFGRLAFRFLLNQPGQTRQPTVRAYNQPQ